MSVEIAFYVPVPFIAGFIGAAIYFVVSALWDRVTA